MKKISARIIYIASVSLVLVACGQQAPSPASEIQQPTSATQGTDETLSTLMESSVPPENQPDQTDLSGWTQSGLAAYSTDGAYLAVV